MSKFNKSYVIVFYCVNTREYTNIPSCSGKLIFNSSRLQEGGFVNTLVKLYNKANLLIHDVRHHTYFSAIKNESCLESISRNLGIDRASIDEIFTNDYPSFEGNYSVCNIKYNLPSQEYWK